MQAGWTSYDAASAGKIEASFARGPSAPTLTLRMGPRKVKYDFDLRRMVQVNQQTRFPRPIRRQNAAGVRPSEIWEFHDRRWVAYDENSAEQCAAALRAGWPCTTLHLQFGEYGVDLQNMQQINSATHYKRRVRRSTARGIAGAGAAGPGAAGAGAAAAGAGATGAAGGAAAMGFGGKMMSMFGFDGSGSGGGGSGGCSPTRTFPGQEDFQMFSSSADHAFADAVKWNILSCEVDFDPKTLCPITGEEFGDGIDDPVVQLPCHTPGSNIACIFHMSTIARSLRSNPRCPMCKFHYPLPGPQPSGTMAYYKSSTRCSGFGHCGSIEIRYTFHSGVQGQQHPHPGVRFYGTNRHAYLPDCTEGREALELLIEAFKRGLSFKVDKSITTNQDNQTVWAGIHHKTSPSGGTSHHGWPDKGYFGRLKSECAAVGVFDAATKAEIAKQKQAVAATAPASKRAPPPAGVSRSGCLAGQAGGGKQAGADQAQQSANVDAALNAVQKELQAAMGARDTAKIRTLMAKRKELMAKK